MQSDSGEAANQTRIQAVLLSAGCVCTPGHIGPDHPGPGPPEAVAEAGPRARRAGWTAQSVVEQVRVGPGRFGVVGWGRVGSGGIRSGRVGWGQVGSGRVGSGGVGSGRVGSGGIGSRSASEAGRHHLT